MNKIILIILLLIGNVINVKNDETLIVKTRSINSWVKNCEKETPSYFKQKMAQLESSDRLQAVNSLGYMGKYQFSRETLRGLNFDQKQIDLFLSSESIQEEAMNKLITHNTEILKNYDLIRFIGQEVDGVKITMEGMLAGAHLRGPYSVKKYLTSGGQIDDADAYGTTVSKYIKSFEYAEEERGEY